MDVYISGRDELRLMDLKTFENTTLLKDEFWALEPPAPQFSPDDMFFTVPSAILNWTFYLSHSVKSSTCTNTDIVMRAQYGHQMNTLF
jgi:hypothetical protein